MKTKAIFLVVALFAAASAVAVEAATADDMNLGFRIVATNDDFRFGPADSLAPVGMSLADGLMLKDGKPHFWIGQGDGPGASQQSPLGLWLAWLQGTDAVTLNHGWNWNIREDADGTAVVEVSPDKAILSWHREALRLGMLTDWFDGVDYSRLPNAQKEIIESHPELAKAIQQYGHYLKTDFVSDAGRAVDLASRGAVARHLLGEEPGSSYMELAREPAPNPDNERVRRGFREWAKAKYGDSLETADAVWGVAHPSWDDVVPPHLDNARWPFRGPAAVLNRRRHIRESNPPFYWDWIGYLQDDTTTGVKNEIDALHAAAPGIPFTIDMRSHTHRHDGYAALVPERIAPFEDLVSIHSGTHAYWYANAPWVRNCLLDSAAFPLFSMNYFRVNTDGAIVNAEDIISSAKAASSDPETMLANCLGGLCSSPWKFKEDLADEGKAVGWQEPSFNDADWDDIGVPGAWDTKPGHSGYGGVAWYRKRFTVDGRLRFDNEDGSRRFFLIGRGVAQKGEIWLNGFRLGEVKGWDVPYEFEIGPLLNYGGENVLVWRVDGQGKSENGLRFASYILANDMMAVPVPFDARQHRMMLFTQLFEGLSGNWTWHWHDDAVRLWQPELKAQVETVAEAVLPAIRKRRGSVALLYAFRDALGLPFNTDGTWDGYGDWQCALDFLGHKPDIFGERRFREEVTPERYPLLVVPYAKMVEDATWEHFKRYVQAGGKALVTDDSLLLSYSRYEQTDLATFDRGAGEVVFVRGRPKVAELMDLLSMHLPPPEVEIESATAGERPVVERLLVGSDTRKALYLCNWGGFDQKLTVSIPDTFRDWRVTNVVGDFRRDPSTGHLAVEVPSQDVAVALLDAPGAQAAFVRAPSPLRMEKLLALRTMLDAAVPPDRADVLFGREQGGGNLRCGFRLGPELFPELLRAASAFGCSYGWSDPSTWRAETLKGRKLVIFAEGKTTAFFGPGRFSDKNKDALVDYVREGGSLLLAAHSAYSVNVNAKCLANWGGSLGQRFGAVLDNGLGLAFDPGNAPFGDPFQVLTRDVAPGPVSDGVRSVQLFQTRRLAFPAFKNGAENRAAAVVSAKGADGKSAPVMAAIPFGNGRVFVCADLMSFQPFRIEHADNAALLANVFGWMLDTPVDDAMREAFRANLFLTERDAREMLSQEMPTTFKP